MKILGFLVIVLATSAAWALVGFESYRRRRKLREQAFQQMFDEVLNAAAPMITIGLSGHYSCSDCGGPHNVYCSPEVTEHLEGCNGLIRYKNVNAVLSQFEDDLIR